MVIYIVIIALVIVMLVVSNYYERKGERNKKHKIIINNSYEKGSLFSNVISKVISRKKLERVEKKLKFIPLTSESFYLIKVLLMIVILVIAIGIRKTNYEALLVHLDDIQTSRLSTEVDTEQEEQEIEIRVYQYLREKLDTEMVRDEINKAFIFDKLHQAIYDLGLNKSSIDISRIKEGAYLRLLYYSDGVKSRWLVYLISAFSGYYLPGFIVMLYNHSIRNRKHEELIHLKTILMIEANIKPSNFERVVSRLQEESRYYRELLNRINEMSKSSESFEMEFREVVKILDDTERSFFDRFKSIYSASLDHVLNQIKDSYKLDALEHESRFNKKKNKIEIIGTLSLALIMFLGVLKLLLPITQNMNIDIIKF